MKDILFHSAPALARELAEKLDDLLDQLPETEASSLRRSLVTEPHDKPRMVLTGQYSSGKSTLIKALTDGAAEVIIDSAIATDSAETYDWGGLVDLVDTPGVQAGLERHDAVAEAEIAGADLILFTVTVDLFDDRLIDHLRHVTEALKKSPQLIIVLTKSRSMAAAPGVRNDAVRDALGDFADLVPWVECDAKTYLQGLEEADLERAARRVEASNLQEVKAAINGIARDRGGLARYRVPLQKIATTAGAAQVYAAEDPSDVAALTVLARQRAALTTRLGLVESALRTIESQFRTACITAAQELVSTVEATEESAHQDWARVESATEELNIQLARAHSRLVHEAQVVMESQLADLASEIREIEASPYARRLTVPRSFDDADRVAADFDLERIATPIEGPRQPTRERPDFVRHLKKFHETWGAGDGVKAAVGTPGHRIVYGLGKKVGYKFRPYEAVSLANNVGKVARIGTVALPIAMEAYDIIREEREEEARFADNVRRRNRIVGRILAQSDRVAEQALGPAKDHLATEFRSGIEDIDIHYQAIRDAAADRSVLSQGLADIESQALAMLDRLAIGTIDA